MIGVDDIVTAVSGVAGKLIDRLWPDPTQAAAAKLELLKMEQTGELAQLASTTDLLKGQLDINKAEAGNSNVFVAGWRPFIRSEEQRLNSSHPSISYAVFCLKKKK